MGIMCSASQILYRSQRNTRAILGKHHDTKERYLTENGEICIALPARDGSGGGSAAVWSQPPLAVHCIHSELSECTDISA